jgi:hypothetical protein
MKIRLRQNVAILLAVTVATVLVAGCATSGRKSTSQTEAAIANLEDRMELGIAQIDAVVIGLQSMEGKQGKELEKAYDVFKKEVAQIEKMAANVRGRLDAMKKQGEAHFEAWERNMAELDDEELRQMSQTRKAELKKKYGGLAQALETTGAEYREFMDGVNNVVKFLDLDLTPASVNMLGDRVTRMEKDAGELKEALQSVTLELGKLAADMGTGGSQS